MAKLVLEETGDRFAVLYDLVALVEDGAAVESALVSAAQLSADTVSHMLAFMLELGFVKTTKSDSEFRITALGSNFLQEYHGMRRFLS